MSVLLEKTVQERAHQFLQKRYRRQARRGRLFARMEVRTRRKYGGKRADGVLAFQHWLLGPWVVSMEAKSIKTLTAIKPYRSHRRWWRNVLWTGLLICIASGAIFALVKMEEGPWQFLLPLNVLVIGGIVYGLLTLSSARHKEMDVIRQLRQYPANEKWLAFSRDSVHALNADRRKKLLKICQRRGIGLLLIKKRGAPEVWNKPRWKWK
ncbi:MAG: hypothetical protein AAFO94_23150, partial [Bacteroidota bacterium]